jgi:hypothetical protein
MIIIFIYKAYEIQISWNRLYIFRFTMTSPTNPNWARVVGYGPFSLWVIHKEGLCPSSGDINRLMMMMTLTVLLAAEFALKYITYVEGVLHIIVGIFSSLIHKM